MSELVHTPEPNRGFPLCTPLWVVETRRGATLRIQSRTKNDKTQENDFKQYIKMQNNRRRKIEWAKTRWIQSSLDAKALVRTLFNKKGTVAQNRELSISKRIERITQT